MGPGTFLALLENVENNKKQLTNHLHLPKQARIFLTRCNRMNSVHLNIIVIIAAAGIALSSLLLLLLVGNLKLPGLIMA